MVGLLVIACAIAIAVLNTDSNTNKAEISGGVPVSATTYVLPMQNAVVAKDYSGSELQYNDTLKQWEIHKAVDFVAGEDAKVMAVADGKVTNVYTNYLEGSVVEISHNNGLVSVYKSLTNVTVSVGDKVTAGQKIGEASETMAQEINTGKHLHFEMLLNGKKVDPNNYLALGNK